MKPLLCLLGFHKWRDCRCTRSGRHTICWARRDQHKWDPCGRRCRVCGTTREVPDSVHVWGECACTLCHLPRYLHLERDPVYGFALWKVCLPQGEQQDRFLSCHDWGPWTPGREQVPGRAPESRTCRRCGCRHVRGGIPAVDEALHEK